MASWLAAGAATRVAEEAPFAGHASRSVDQLAGFLDAFLAVLPTAPRALIPPGLQVTFRRMLWDQGNQLLLLLWRLLLVHLDVQSFHVVQIPIRRVVQRVLVLVRHQHGHRGGRSTAARVRQTVVAHRGAVEIQEILLVLALIRV